MAGHDAPALKETTTNIRGRVKKLEKVSGEAGHRAGIHTDPVLWTHRFRAADPANEQVYQDICSHGDTYETDYFYRGRPSEVPVVSCFSMLHFPIKHAVFEDSEPSHGGFDRTPELHRRLVRSLWQYLRTDRGPFPLYHDLIEALAGAEGADTRDLWCWYSDLADLRVADRQHPTVLEWRQYVIDKGRTDVAM